MNNNYILQHFEKCCNNCRHGMGDPINLASYDYYRCKHQPKPVEWNGYCDEWELEAWIRTIS